MLYRMHNYYYKLYQKNTVAEKGHPPPPSATMNRARLILNGRGKDNKRAR